jgi:hypothetical protein
MLSVLQLARDAWVGALDFMFTRICVAAPDQSELPE